MTIAALIPTYNRRSHVLRAIESVVAQTLQPDEIIVVDDGSTDGTADAILGKYGSRVRLIRKNNGGVSAARNRAVSESRCEWVAFLDSDDQWLPNKLERQCNALGVLGGQYGACFTNCSFGGNPRFTATAFEEAGLQSESSFGALDRPQNLILAKKCALYIQSALIARQLFLEIGGFDESLHLVEDSDLTFRLSYRTRFCYVTDPLVIIDRETAVPRLTDALGSWDDRTFAYFEVFAKKILADPIVTEKSLHNSVRAGLIDLYFSQAKARLMERKLRAAFDTLAKIRGIGATYGEILTKLAGRAIGKVERTLKLGE